MILFFSRTGTPSRVVIGGWFGREPIAFRMGRDVGIRSDRPSLMISPRRPWPCGGSPDAALLLGDPARDEPLDPNTVLGEDARAPRTGRPTSVAHAVHDELEDVLDREDAGDPADSITQRLDGRSPRDIELTDRELVCCVTHPGQRSKPPDAGRDRRPAISGRRSLRVTDHST